MLPIPKDVLKKIDALCRSFIWTRNHETSRKSPVAWSRVCKSRKQGGYTIINLFVQNVVNVMKCLWNICKKSGNMWVKWILTYYIKGDKVMET